MAEDQRSRGFAAKEQKLQNELDNLQSRYDDARKLLEEPGGKDTSRMKVLDDFYRKLMSVKQQLKDLRGYVVPPTPKNRPASKNRVRCCQPQVQICQTKAPPVLSLQSLRIVHQP
jgi:hypothetical protein